MFNDLQFNELKESFFAQVESLVNDLDFQLLKQIIEQPPQFMMQLDQNLFSNVKTEFNNLIEKLDYLNIRKNTKELILKLCIIKSLRYLEDSINIIIDSEIDNLNDKEESLSIQLNRLYEISYHLNPYWVLNKSQNRLCIHFEQKTKRQSSLKSSGSYYTPYKLAKFMAEVSLIDVTQNKKKVIAGFISDIQNDLMKIDEISLINKFKRLFSIKILDPGLGSGIFFYFLIPKLVFFFREMRSFILKSADQLNSNPNIIRFLDIIKIHLPFLKINDNKLPSCLFESNLTQQIILFIIKECIYGIDIDEKAIILSKILLEMRIRELYGFKSIKKGFFMEHFQFYKGNSIISIKDRNIDKETIESINSLNGIIWEDLMPSVFDLKQLNDPKLIGFDIIICNPPWNILKINDREFFSDYDSKFQSYSRKKQDLIKESLLNTNSDLFQDYSNQCAIIDKQIKYIKQSGVYKYQSAFLKGVLESSDPQLYKFYLELCFNILSIKGVMVFLVQNNFLGSKGCSGLRKLYLLNGTFQYIWELRNKLDDQYIFSNVDPNQRFILFSFAKTNNKSQNVFYKKCYDFSSVNMQFMEYNRIPVEFIERFSKEEYQIFTFKSNHHKNLFNKMINHKMIDNGLSINEISIPITLKQDLHVTKHRSLIKSVKPPQSSLPVLGGKNIVFFKTYLEQIKYFIGNEDYLKAESDVECIVCRNILPNSAKRLIFSIIPPHTLIDNSCTRVLLDKSLIINHEDWLDSLYYLLSILNSLVIEFFVKTFLTGINLNYYILKKIPIPPFNPLDNSVKRLIENTKYLCLNHTDNKLWANKYMENEIIINHLFNLTKTEFEEILNDFDFEKLKKTNFSGHKPFFYINKKNLIEKF